MTEAITATPGIRVVDGRQVPEANRGGLRPDLECRPTAVGTNCKSRRHAPMPEMRQKTGTAKAIANPTTTSGLVMTTSTL
jgi:hypothetical protein